MKLIRISCLSAVLFALFVQTVSGQSFVNLDFEQAGFYVSPTPANGWGDFIDPALAFPGWTVLPNSNPYFPTSTFYNDLSLGGPAVNLMGPNFPNRPGYGPLQGSYSVLLQYFGIGGPPTLSQTGLIPDGTESINFLVGPGESDAVVTLNGVNIPLVPISGGRVAGDISAFAGSVAQLTFSTTSNAEYIGNWLYFDDIQFSESPVPEPASFVLFGLGVLFLGRKSFVYLYHDAMNKLLDA
jgi:PEP-CTERM motif